jgi:hypothetical protein
MSRADEADLVIGAGTPLPGLESIAWRGEAAPAPISLNSPISSAGPRTCSAGLGNGNSIHLPARQQR